MPLYQRHGIWYIDIRNGSGRIRRSTRTTDKRTAQEQHDRLAARAWKIRVHGKHLSDALLAWYNAKTRKSTAQGTLRQIRANYKDRPLAEVTDASIEAVFGAKKPGTYNRIANIFRASLNIAHAAGWIDATPKIKRRHEPRFEPRYLTSQEWKGLRAELPGHLVPMADFAIATGLRWANVAGLTWERISIARKLAWVPASTAKAGKTLSIPLSAAAIRALQAFSGKRTGLVFTYNGKRIGSPKTAWRKATIRAGLAGFRWHDLRHTWASWHAMRGTPLDVLQKLGGWQTREMVERYAHLAPTYLAQFAGNARPVRHNFGHSRSAKAA
jgi:integrase